MIFSFFTENNDSIIGVISLNKNSEEFLAKLKHRNWYIQEIKFMNENRKQEWLAIRFLIKSLLGREKRIFYTKKGEPYFDDQEYQIGISHTKGYAAIILSKKRTVSIDIQRLTLSVKKVKTRFITKYEETNLSLKNMLLHLLLYWCGKETLYKVLGRNNVNFKTQLHICPFKLNIDKLSSFIAYETKTKQYQFFLIQYKVLKDYILCWVG